MDRHFLHRPRRHAQPDVDPGERARVLAELEASRSLSDVLDSETAVIASVLVREVLEALPTVDRIHAGQVLHALGIGEHSTIGQLADVQLQRLRRLFPPATAA